MNKIIHGDALEQLKLLDDNSIDLIVTDTPYIVEKMGGQKSCSFVKRMARTQNEMKSDGLMDGFNIQPILKEFMRVVKKTNIYISQIFNK